MSWVSCLLSWPECVSFLDTRDIAVFRLTLASRKVGFGAIWALVFHISTVYATKRDWRYQRLEFKNWPGYYEPLSAYSSALTNGCSSLLTENGLHPLYFSLMNAICDEATKFRYLYQFISRKLNSFKHRYYPVNSREIYGTMWTYCNW